MNAQLLEDNAGTLAVVAYEDDAPVWFCVYGPDSARDGYSPEEVAAMDFCGIAVQGLDPVSEGWEGDDPAGADDFFGGIVAASGLTPGRDFDAYPWAAGVAGRKALEALGVHGEGDDGQGF